VAELADAADSKSAGALLRVGSSPSTATNVFPAFSFVLKHLAVDNSQGIFWEKIGIEELRRAGFNRLAELRHRLW
jgi:hypothetical protein